MVYKHSYLMHAMHETLLLHNKLAYGYSHFSYFQYVCTFICTSKLNNGSYM